LRRSELPCESLPEQLNHRQACTGPSGLADSGSQESAT
jgi:hypothetical protein